MRTTVVLLASALAACTGIGGPIVEPKIELSQLALRSAGLRGGTLEAVLNITNPNEFDIRGTKLELSLDIQGSHFGDMRLQDTFNLRKKEVTPVTLPLTFDWAGVGSAARAAIDYGTVNYTIKGNATVVRGGGDGGVVVPFSQDGTLPISRLTGAGSARRDSTGRRP